jgi:hypothetical protein
MNPAPDPLYLIHRQQAARRGMTPLSRDQFSLRLRGQSDTDLTQLLLPQPQLTLRLRVRRAPRFDLGRLCITPNAAKAVPAREVIEAVARHATGDWGLLSAHDRQQNEEALRHGSRLVSVYRSRHGQRFYVITEASRELTTVLLPEDY